VDGLPAAIEMASVGNVTRLDWFRRPDRLAPTALFLVGVVMLVAAPVVFGGDAMTAERFWTLGLLATSIGGGWVMLAAWLARARDPEVRWLITRAIMRIADVALLLPVFIFVAAPVHFGGGLHHDEPARLFDVVPAGTALLVAGYTGIVVGWVWIRRIARGDPEPEANDRHWLSRA
jgi:hypothetical protein